MRSPREAASPASDDRMTTDLAPFALAVVAGGQLSVRTKMPMQPGTQRGGPIGT
jgi:hypothetical protein